MRERGLRGLARGIAGLVGTAIVVGGVLGGCGTPTVPPLPTPTATAAFASDEEALAAAEAAYAAYLEVSRVISEDGGRDPERIEGYAAGDLLASAYEGFASLHDKGWRIEGEARIVKSVLQFVAPTLGEQSVGAYFCVDVSGTDVLNSDGESVVAPDRADVFAVEVVFDALNEDELVPSITEPWEASLCAQ